MGCRYIVFNDHLRTDRLQSVCAARLPPGLCHSTQARRRSEKHCAEQAMEARSAEVPRSTG